MTADTTRAVRVHAHGGPEVLSFEEIALPPPGPGEARLRQEAVGLNFIDVYHRTGLYPRKLPFVIGQESAGVVDAVGEGVADVRPGDRVVVYAPGAYAERRNAPADLLVKLPDAISAEAAAATYLKGLTAEMLLFRIVAVERGWPILVHAAAGGVGLIVTRWAAALGCEVIGTVGSKAKAERARAAGCAHTILYEEEDVPARVRAITRGRGVRVAYDSVGAATQMASLDSLGTRGWYITFGNASGPAAPVKPLDLLSRGSLLMTRPSVQHYIAEKAERDAAAARLFAAMEEGSVRADIGQRFPLSQAADAHRALESRQTMGATVLVP